MPNPPIVFVPGFAGSFNLPLLLDWRAPSLSGWNFPPFVDYGRAFVSACERAGYTRNRDLFVAFYDWRKSVTDSATTYLARWIDRAKSASGSSRVALVAHSMGGLAARTYVQSTSYRNDVAHLITLGTPHRGAANAYYPWGGGDINWGGMVQAVLNVYLWYLARIHPFQTGLNRLKTIRTQIVGLRDLLPQDGYLCRAGSPPVAIPEDEMHERNLWSDVWNTPGALALLLSRTPLTTISGQNFVTLEQIEVGPPPSPPGTPPVYPDGVPLRRITTADGDGTVLLASAQVQAQGATNRPPVQIVHDQLPDRTVDQVLQILGVAAPPPAPESAPAARMVIMAASPVELTIEAMPGAPVSAVLGAPAVQRRAAPRVRFRNYGHRGKPLYMAIIENPQPGGYQVRVRGTASGAFSLGALTIEPTAAAAPSALLGAAAAEAASGALAISEAATMKGMVAAQTELVYTIEYRAPGATPGMAFDAAATLRNAQERFQAARQPAPQGEASLSASLGAGAPPFVAEDIARLAANPAAVTRLTREIAQSIGAHAPLLAAGLIEQIHEAVKGGG